MLGIFGKTYKQVFELLPADFKKRFVRLQGLIVITSVVDLFGLAIFIPVLSAVANPQVIEKNKIFSALKSFTGLDNNNYFLLSLFIAAFIFFIFRSSFIFISNRIQNKFVFNLSEYIGEKAYRHYLDLDYETFLKKDSPEIIRELTVSPQHFSKFLVMPLLLLSTEILVILLIIGGIALYDFNVFILLICTIFPVALFF